MVGLIRMFYLEIFIIGFRDWSTAKDNEFKFKFRFRNPFRILYNLSRWVIREIKLLAKEK